MDIGAQWPGMLSTADRDRESAFENAKKGQISFSQYFFKIIFKWNRYCLGPLTVIPPIIIIQPNKPNNPVKGSEDSDKYISVLNLLFFIL